MCLYGCISDRLFISLLTCTQPLNKFLLVKGIVFFTWAQSLAISLAFYFVYDYKVLRFVCLW